MHQGHDDSRSFSTFLSSLLLSLSEISSLAKDSQIEREAMSEFALFVERIAPMLTDLKEIEAADAAPIREAVESLENELNRSRKLVRNSDSIRSVREIEDVVHDLGRCLGLVLLACLDVSVEIKESIGALHKEMIGVRFDSDASIGSSDRHDNDNEIVECIQIVDEALHKEMISVKFDSDASLGSSYRHDNDNEIVECIQNVDEALHKEMIGVKFDSDASIGSSYRHDNDNEIVECIQNVDETLHKEMIGVKFDSDASIGSSYRHDNDNEIVECIQNEDEGGNQDLIVLDADDLALHLKKGSDEEFGVALSELRKLIGQGLVENEWIIDKGIVQILLNRLSSSKHNSRLAIILILRSIASKSDDIKEMMADVGALSAIARSLTRDVEERREAVGLLLSLSVILRVRQRMGKVQGCIVMLVAMLNGDDPSASHDAERLLTALSGNTQNALHMAEAGYFKPLVQYLKQGTDMNKILMATALSRMELTDQSRAALADEGSIQALAKMFNSGKLEAKLSSLGALQNLSTLTENVQRLISSGIVAPLLQLLFSVTSVLMTLREPASAILASVAQSELILINQDVAQQMLSLLSLSSPVIQYHLLRALNSIVSHSSASMVRVKMKESGAVQLLLPFLTVSNTEIRNTALSLLFNLSKDMAGELTEQLGETHLNVITNIISVSTSEKEKTAALGVLSNLPVNNKKATEILIKAHLLPIVVSLMGLHTSTSTPATSCLLESITGVLVRFTVPWDKKLQRVTAELGVIPLLVKLLSIGSPLTKCKAATSLAQLSQNSLSLSKAKASRWMCVRPSTQAFCEVHDSYCFIKSTFCLVKAGAISPLVHILEGKDREADEAVLDALATLMQDEIWENGSKTIAKVSGVQAIIRVLEVGSVKAQERALWLLERIFRIEAHREQYGESAQVILIDLAQNGAPTLKSTIAKILAHLQLLQMQSSYF